MTHPLAIGLAGAGLIGQRHADYLAQCAGTRLAAVADPAAAGAELANRQGAAHYNDVDAMLDAGGLDGVILATPNALHLSGASSCLRAGIPVLVEKPVAANGAEAAQLVMLQAQTGTPLLVGHHRRHNPVITAARTALKRGDIGQPVAAHVTTLFRKPDAYFDAGAWRKQPGAGPVMINLIHDVDLMRHLLGEVTQVTALTSAATRRFQVEDTAGAVLRMDSGAIVTLILSDTALSPASWELTAGENPDYPSTGDSCYRISGTHGMLDLPGLTLWGAARQPDWHSPLRQTTLDVHHDDPLALQISHFADVIRGRSAPLVPAIEGARSLDVVESILTAAATGRTITLTYPHEQEALHA